MHEQISSTTRAGAADAALVRRAAEQRVARARAAAAAAVVARGAARRRLSGSRPCVSTRPNHRITF